MWCDWKCWNIMKCLIRWGNALQCDSSSPPGSMSTFQPSWRTTADLVSKSDWTGVFSNKGEQNSEFGMHEHTDLAELSTIHGNTLNLFVDTLFNGLYIYICCSYSILSILLTNKVKRTSITPGCLAFFSSVRKPNDDQFIDWYSRKRTPSKLLRRLQTHDCFVE